MKVDLTPIDAPSIKSRPVYAPLEPRPGKLHVIVADCHGAEAVTDMLAKANDRSGMLAGCHVMYCPGPTGVDLSAQLEALGAAQYFRAPTIRHCCRVWCGSWRTPIWERSSIWRGPKA